jgi:DNA-binding transcriptional ArsR family regulator
MTSTAPTELRIADDLALPLDTVTETLAILAKRGAGKTYLGMALAEELLDAGLHPVVLDPTGVWWGLRSSADGKRPGFPVVIFGGDHADLPLEPGTGRLLADLVVDQRIPAILDLNFLRKGQQLEFVADFLEQLYHRKGRQRDPLHLLIDEADRFAPQRAKPETSRSLGAMEDVFRLGRSRGLGATAISQRAAVLNKNVLTQVETLICLRMTGPQDRAAIDDWVEQHGDRRQRDLLLTELAALPIGTAWWWSPGWLGHFGRHRTRERLTFDSSATPKAGQSIRPPREFAQVDLERLRDQLAAQVAAAEARDPVRLRRRIGELERELTAARAAQPAPVVERVEIQVLDEDLVGRLEAGLVELSRILSPVSGAADELKRVSSELGTVGDELGEALVSVRLGPQGGGLGPAAGDAEGDRQGRRPAARAAGAGADGDTTAAEASAGAGDVDLSKGARALLEVFTQHYPLQLTRMQWATLARRGKRSSSYPPQIAELLRAGLAEEVDKRLRATGRGLAVAGRSGRPAETAAEILQAWREALPDGPRAMLDAMLAAGEPLPRDELARRAGFSPTSSSVGAHLKVLRDNDLVEETSPPDRQVRVGGALAAGEPV